MYVFPLKCKILRVSCKKKQHFINCVKQIIKCQCKHKSDLGKKIKSKSRSAALLFFSCFFFFFRYMAIIKFPYTQQKSPLEALIHTINIRMSNQLTHRYFCDVNAFYYSSSLNVSKKNRIVISFSFNLQCVSNLVRSLQLRQLVT